MLLILVIYKIQESCIHFGLLLDISPENLVFLKTFSNIEISFIDQNSNPIEMEGKIIITLVIH